MRELETRLTAGWRDYCRLYPAELRQPMIAGMARLISAGKGTSRDHLELSRWTMRGRDCGEHEATLAGFYDCVSRVWRLKAGTIEEPMVEKAARDLFDELLLFGVEVDEPTPFDQRGIGA